MIFGVLKHRFVLNTTVNSNVIKSTTQSGATWQKSATPISMGISA